MTDELTLLRGAVRDGVASIENFANVLSSRRVGPKVIAHALPELRVGCIALAGVFDSLRAEMRPVLAGDPRGAEAAEEMLVYAKGRLGELATELERREKRALDARERLALDAVARAVSGELAGVVRVVDLLSVAAKPRASAIELGDLLAQKRTLMGARSAPITLSVVFGSSLTFIADAQVVMDLLLFAIGALVRAGVTSPLLTVRTTDKGQVVLKMERPQGALPADAAKRVIDVPVRTPLPREDEVLIAAARRAGIELGCETEPPSIWLRL